MRAALIFFFSLLACAFVNASDQRLILQLSSGINAERGNAAYLLGMSKDPGVVGLLLRQLQEETVRENKLVIIESLKKLDSEEGYYGLSTFYQNESDSVVRRKVIQALGESGDRQYVPLIAKNLELTEAFSALSRIDHPEAAKVLLTAYGSARSRSQKERILAAIAAQGRIESVKPLISYGQQAKDPLERVWIAETLADLGEGEVQDAIYQWFQDSNDSISKRRLVKSLKSIGSSKMVEKLSKDLRTNDLNLKIEIVEVMVFIDKQAAAPYLRSYYEESMERLDPNMSKLEAVKTARLYNLLRQNG